MTLRDLSAGIIVEIVAFSGGMAMTQRLHAFGLFAGSRLRLVRKAPFHGPLLVEDLATGARMMIGRGMAAKIEVSRGDPS
jgi:ferrous iron transport protein A